MNENLPIEMKSVEANVQSNSLLETFNTSQPEVMTQTPPITPSVSKKPINKVLLITVVMATIIILGVGLIFSNHYYENKIIPSSSQMEQVTTNSLEGKQTAFNEDVSTWTTYINPTHKYSFKYPSGWKVDWPYPPDGFVFVQLTDNSDTMSMMIGNHQNPDSLLAKAYYERMINNEKSSDEGFVPPAGTEDIVINGVDAYHTINNFAGDGGIDHYYLTNGKTVVDIFFYTTSADVPDNKLHIEVFNKILSTFKFTE